MKIFFTMLFSDLHWKILSLLAALVLWFVGMNFSDPPQNVLVTPSLRLDNLEVLGHERIMLLNLDELRGQNIQVGVRGLRSNTDMLRTATPARLAQIMQVSIDFRAVDVDAVHDAYGEVVQQLWVSVNFLVPDYFEHVSISPSYVNVRLDAEAFENVPIDIVEHGFRTPNFQLQPITLANNRVTITGARSVLETMDSVQASVDISGILGEHDETVRLQVLDNWGRDITDRVRLSVTETTATVRVWPIQSRPIHVEGSGSLAHGFAVAGVEPVYGTFYIVGSEATLEDMEYLLVEIDWSGMSESFVYTADLAEWLPAGARLYNEDAPYVDINVTVEPIEIQLFNVPSVEVRIWGITALYEVLETGTHIPVMVSGPRSRIADMTAATIELGMDLRGLSIGTHTVPLAVSSLPQGVSVIGTPPTMRVQIHAPAVVGNDDDDDDYELFTIPPMPPPPELPYYYEEEHSDYTGDEYPPYDYYYYDTDDGEDDED